jgi:molecular chaperone DnaK (HSP70)
VAEVFGLDFGTTNSLAALVQNQRVVSLVNQTDNLPHPSAVWIRGDEMVVGREAKDQLTDVESDVVGDIIRSPKAFVGRSGSVHVAGSDYDITEVLSAIFRFIREDALARGYPGLSFDRAVVAVPVDMGGRGRRELRDAALKADLHAVQFVHEPLAALYGYLRSQTDFTRRLSELEGQVALVFDWGGGTLDLTLCRIEDGTLVQITNRGDNRVGGDDFDRRIARNVRDSHAREHGLTELPPEMPGADAKLMQQCETAKINLSRRSSATVFVPNFLRSDGPEKRLEVVLTRDELVGATGDLVNLGLRNIDDVLSEARLHEGSIAVCVATGGMVQMPYIRERLIELFGPSRVPNIANGDRIIAEGAAWIAEDNRRVHLAKPFEVLHADTTYAALIPRGTELPTENQQLVREFGMYCVDPRDGYARFVLARPVWPGRTHVDDDDRQPYATLLVAVDPTAGPLLERLDLKVEIDHDLVARISAESSLRGDRAEIEVHDLEFGLALGNASG